MDPKESSVDDDEVEPPHDQGGAASDEGEQRLSEAVEAQDQPTTIVVDENSCELLTSDDLETKMKIKEDDNGDASKVERGVDAVTTITVTTPSGSTAAASTPTSSKPRRAKAPSTKAAAPDVPEDMLDLKLPHQFHLKYLGKRDAAGIWGFKYTRKPVDALVAAARQRSPINPLPFLQLTVSIEGMGIQLVPGSDTKDKDYPKGLIPIHAISYGVQDLVYTRVFAMIVVSETNNVREKHPFQCHAFVSDSRQTARLLTYALAEAFKQFSKTVKAEELRKTQKRFAIDLREPEEMKAEEVVDDSEA